jgi:hypothetical protein
VLANSPDTLLTASSASGVVTNPDRKVVSPEPRATATTMALWL